MKNLIIFLYFISFGLAHAQEPTIKMEIVPETINSGQHAVLTWKVSNADRIYISSLGKVGTSGRQELSPDKTKTYSLIADGPNGIASRSIEVVVKGSKGNGECPKEDMLKHPFTYKAIGNNYTDVIDIIHGVLQNEMGFSIQREYELRNGPFIFLTNCSQKGYLLNKSDKTIGSRRIAYEVEIKGPSSSNNFVEYTIRSAIQYRKRIIETWRQESTDSLYLQESKRLQVLISMHL